MHDLSIYIYPTGSPRTPGCIDFLYKRLSIQHNSLRVIFLNTCQNAPTIFLNKSYFTKNDTFNKFVLLK